MQAILALRAFEGSSLTLGERGVLGLLLGCMDADGVAYPGHQYLAESFGCSVRLVERAIHKAVDLGLLVRIQKKNGRGIVQGYQIPERFRVKTRTPVRSGANPPCTPPLGKEDLSVHSNPDAKPPRTGVPIHDICNSLGPPGGQSSTSSGIEDTPEVRQALIDSILRTAGAQPEKTVQELKAERKARFKARQDRDD